jgi:hypothetical protein
MKAGIYVLILPDPGIHRDDIIRINQSLFRFVGWSLIIKSDRYSWTLVVDRLILDADD